MKRVCLHSPSGERKHFFRRAAWCASLLSYFFLAITITTISLHAQHEHVPVKNPVYDFLLRMQVKGTLPEYSHAALPLERQSIVLLLDSLETQRVDLTQTEQALLDRFKSEFTDEARKQQKRSILFCSDVSFGERVNDIFSDEEKFLYAWQDSTTTFFMELLANAEYRTVLAKGKNSNVTLAQIGGRFRGTVKSFLGYGLEATNGTEFGSRSLALEDPVLRQNSNFNDFKRPFFDFTEAYLNANFGWGNMVLGKERVLIGNSFASRLIVSDNAPTFDALRFGVRFGDFSYSFLHSSILGQKEMLEDGKPYYEPRFFAMHRAEIAFSSDVRLGVFESVIYTGRFLDLAYINPINFFKSAEHALGDRDNPFLGFDLTINPINEIQLFGTWLIDDVDASKWGTGWWGNKFAWQGGLLTTALIPNGELGIEYTRIEPYTFSHFFSGNEYTHKGYIIGSELQPNSDQWHIRYQHWIDARMQFSFLYRTSRHGNNEYNSQGKLLVNHGGDALVGFKGERDRDHILFLEGILSHTQILGLDFRYELWRNIVFDFRYHYRRQQAPGATASASDHFLSLLLDIAY